MAKDVKIFWNYTETGGHEDKHQRIGDVEFYRSLGIKDHIRTTDGRIPLGGPTFNQIIFWGGSAIVSSSVLATAIKAYVTLNRRKIVITIKDKKLEYEGPNLEHDEKTIEAMIDKLTDETNSTDLRIYADRT